MAKRKDGLWYKRKGAKRRRRLHEDKVNKVPAHTSLYFENDVIVISDGRRLFNPTAGGNWRKKGKDVLATSTTRAIVDLETLKIYKIEAQNATL